jgi:2,4-dienoyl-CoA reductase (NADPH2)
MESTGYLIN